MVAESLNVVTLGIIECILELLNMGIKIGKRYGECREQVWGRTNNWLNVLEARCISGEQCLQR